MRGKFEAPKKKSPILLIIILLVLALSAGCVWFLWSGGFLDGLLPTAPTDSHLGGTTPSGTTDPTTDPTTEPTTEPTTAPTEPEPVPLNVVATATISATGDILPHEGVRNSGLQDDGSYNYENIWTYVTSYVQSADYAVANLETTLRGPEVKYSGYPQFNAPDALASGALDAGFDMLLTANNHCNDTGFKGITRTVTTVREIGLDSLGTVPTEDEPNYAVIEVNGIKIGMMCYTYATFNKDGYPVINGISTNKDSHGLVNAFSYNNLEGFYTEVTSYMEAMETQGAEAYVMFIHWGEEYQLKPNDKQTAVAQGLCDLGIDVIVGGHPHVIQPIDLLTSTQDESHKTVCLYSLGNAVSNQRQGLIKACPTAHTEDGMFFSFTFSRYSDGSVALTGVDILPCWVNRYNGTQGRRVYNILPLDAATRDQWAELYDLGETSAAAAEKSYTRTMDLVGEGLDECRSYLTEAHTQRTDDYWNAQVNGDMVVDPETTLPTYETPAEETTAPTEDTTPTEESTEDTTPTES